MRHFERMGTRARLVLAAAGMMLLAGCSSAQMPDMPKLPDLSSWSCDRPGETSMNVARLYMGGQLPGGAFIGEFEWQQFLSTSVIPRFSDGVYSSDAAYNYLSKAGAGAIQDNIKLLVIVAPSGDATENKIEAVVRDFEARFSRQAVTLVESKECTEKW